jgi:hypothetical protein
MASVSSPRQSEFAPVAADFERLPRVVRALPDGMARPSKRPSLVKRAARGLTRFLFIFCIGVATTLAWQSYGDAARVVIAISFPQLAWLVPQAAPVALTAPDQIAPAAARSLDQLQLKEVSLGLSAVRQSVDQLAAQLTAGQRQMAGDIARLQAEISAPPLQPAAAPARKPVPPTPAPPVR